MLEYKEAIEKISNLSPEFIQAIQPEIPLIVYEGQLCQINVSKMVELCKEEIST